MTGLGTIINVGGILAGGAVGMLFGRKIKSRYQETLMSAVGICVLFMGISGAMEEMLSVAEGGLISGGTMVIIASITLGAFVGELLNIEGGFTRFGEWLKRITGSEGDASFVDGFVTASLTVCIGAMAVVGALKDGLTGDYSILAAKAVLDLVIVLILTVSKGKGCIFSAIPVFLFQGAITLLARFLEPVMTPAAFSNLSLIGSILIFCVGLNLVWGKKIKVANLLPSIVIAVGWAFLPL